MATSLIISDLHCPFHHADAFDFLADLRREFRPDAVYCSGDEADMHNFARWDREADSIGPNEELQQLRNAIKQLAKIFPRLVLANSNHSLRPLKKAAGIGLSPRQFLRSLREILCAPESWTWHDTIDAVDFVLIHGEGYAGARAATDAATDYGCNVVIGHVHSHAGVWHTATPGGRRWAMNVGCLIDPTSPAFMYAKHHRRSPVLGCGLVCDGVPLFRPMESR